MRPRRHALLLALATLPAVLVLPARFARADEPQPQAALRDQIDVLVEASALGPAAPAG